MNWAEGLGKGLSRMGDEREARGPSLTAGEAPVFSVPGQSTRLFCLFWRGKGEVRKRGGGRGGEGGSKLRVIGSQCNLG